MWWENKGQLTEFETRKVWVRNNGKPFCHEVSQAVEGAAQIGCAVSMLGGFHDLTEQNLEPPGHSFEQKAGLDASQGPSTLKDEPTTALCC